MLVAVSLGGCKSKEAKASFVGKWQLKSNENLAERMMGDGQDSANADTNDVPRLTMEVEFRRDGTLVTRTNVMNDVREKEGEWSLVEERDHYAFIAFELEDESSDRLRIDFETDGSIRLIPPNLFVLEKAYTFERVD